MHTAMIDKSGCFDYIAHRRRTSVYASSTSTRLDDTKKLNRYIRTVLRLDNIVYTQFTQSVVTGRSQRVGSLYSA